MLADRPQVRELSGGRLHLSHGPIDVVLRAWGEPDAVEAAYRAAAGRFGDILPELCRELPRLRGRSELNPPCPSPSGDCGRSSPAAPSGGAWRRPAGRSPMCS